MTKTLNAAQAIAAANTPKPKVVQCAVCIAFTAIGNEERDTLIAAFGTHSRRPLQRALGFMGHKVRTDALGVHFQNGHIA